MPVTHRIDKKLNTVFVKATGEISVEDLMDQETKIILDPDFEKGLNTYADFSEAVPSGNTNIDKLIISREFVESIQNIRGKCKWAIFAPHEHAYTITSIYAELSDKLKIETKVFKDETEARTWLGI
jgi:hypothetical protein